MRSLTLSIALLCAGFSTAHAQQFLLEAGADATLVGDTFFVQAGQNFTVRTILDMQGTSASVTTVSTALAYGIDGATNNRLSFVAGVRDAQFSLLFPTIFFNFVDRRANSFIPANYSASQLPRVIYDALGSVSARELQGSYIVSELTFTNSLALGETYGDASNENGLFMATQTGSGNPNLGSSGFTLRRFGSPKYKVQAVPEPATITVALAGLAFLRTRRKAV